MIWFFWRFIGGAADVQAGYGEGDVLPTDQELVEEEAAVQRADAWATREKAAAEEKAMAKPATSEEATRGSNLDMDPTSSPRESMPSVVLDDAEINAGA